MNWCPASLLADARWGGEDHALVVRVAPLDASNPIFPSYDLDWQFNLIKHVAESTDVPVPQLFWSETSSDALGRRSS